MSDTGRRVTCVSSDRYAASLAASSVYDVIDDPEAEIRGLLRVVDESGEDYLYPATLFAAADREEP